MEINNDNLRVQKIFKATNNLQGKTIWGDNEKQQTKEEEKKEVDNSDVYNTHNWKKQPKTSQENLKAGISQDLSPFKEDKELLEKEYLNHKAYYEKVLKESPSLKDYCEWALEALEEVYQNFKS